MVACVVNLDVDLIRFIFSLPFYTSKSGILDAKLKGCFDYLP